MKKNTIKLGELMPRIIFSRDFVKQILEVEIGKMPEKTIDIDFSGIELVSRSAAHELLKMKERFEYDCADSKRINFVGLGENVAKMIRVVAANIAAPLENREEFKPKRIRIEDLVKV